MKTAEEWDKDLDLLVMGHLHGSKIGAGCEPEEIQSIKAIQSDAYAAKDAELAELRKEISLLLDHFGHYHKHGDNGDICAQCGLDLRHLIHWRVQGVNAMQNEKGNKQ